MNHDNKQEIQYRLLKLLAEEPSMRQKDMARRMGVSVGVVNYCIRELAVKGLIKINRFRNSRNKTPYSYILTPSGIEEKGRIALKFLKRKAEEYEEIKRQIAALTRDVEEYGFRAPGDPEPQGRMKRLSEA